VLSQERANYMRSLLRRSCQLTAPSEYVRRAYAQFGVPEEQVQALPLGLDVSAWPDRPAARTDERAYRFAYLGGMFSHKGAEVAVRSLRSLPEPQVRLRVYGAEMPDDPFVRQVHALAEGDDRIVFCGRYSDLELPSILEHTDVLLLPSLAQETFSFVAREATWAGVPVIASRVGALPEAVEDGVNGFLVEAGDVEALATCLRRFIENPALLGAHSAAQRTRPVVTMREHAGLLNRLYAVTQPAPAGRPLSDNEPSVAEQGMEHGS
jgi:glycosyltransferase involved in cell wall biosynthesis